MDRRLGTFEWVAAIAAVLVAVAAPFKARLGLPFDLTIGASAVLVIVAAGQVAGRGRAPRSALFMVVPAILMAPSLLNASFDSHTTKKAALFFSATIGAGASAAVLRRNQRWCRPVLVGFAIAGLAAALLAIPTSTGRASLTVEGDPISTGRTIASGLIVLVVLALTRRRYLLIGATAALLCVAPLLRTGARGPLLAAAVALAVVVLAGRPTKRWMRTTMVVGAVVAGGWYALTATSEQTQDRFLTFDSGTRIDAIRAGVDALPAHPFGVGLGDFSEVAPLLGLDYPHNLWVEAAIEGGWLAGAGMVAWSAVAIRRAWRRADLGPDDLVLLGLVVFWTLNVAVSGDLNSNRALFVVTGLVVSTRPPRSTPTPPPPTRASTQRRARSIPTASMT